MRVGMAILLAFQSDFFFKRRRSTHFLGHDTLLHQSFVSSARINSSSIFCLCIRRKRARSTIAFSSSSADTSGGIGVGLRCSSFGMASARCSLHNYTSLCHWQQGWSLHLNQQPLVPAKVHL